MRISVGIDIAKEIHWVRAIDADGVVRVNRKLLNTPSDIAALADELTALHGMVYIGLDVIGGIVGLAEAMLAQARVCPRPCAGHCRQPRSPGHG